MRITNGPIQDADGQWITDYPCSFADCTSHPYEYIPGGREYGAYCPRCDAWKFSTCPPQRPARPSAVVVLWMVGEDEGTVISEHGEDKFPF